MEKKLFDSNDKSWAAGPTVDNLQMFFRFAVRDSIQGFEIVLVNMNSYEIVKEDYSAHRAAREMIQRMVDEMVPPLIPAGADK